MVFSSLLFLYYFLPPVILVYYLVPYKYKNSVFLLFSLLFYAWGEPIYVFLMLFSIALNYTVGIGLSKHPNANKKILTLGIATNILLIAIFKYSGFLLSNLSHVTGLPIPIPQISLPLGISFFTFQAISYIIDVYRKEAEPQKNIFDLALYITAFPQLVAGPIVRYTTIMHQLHHRVHSLTGFANGIVRFSVGLAKKIFLANQFAVIADSVFVNHACDFSTATAWIGIIAYTFQIYFDFSGYSDMAIGLGKMFGFEFLENFNYPYISKTASEFWRRWHISLGSWFRDYLYFPLGGSRVSTIKMLRNLLIVWFLTGLWHGASWTFIIWGLYYGFFIGLEKLLKNTINKTPAFVLRIYCLLVVVIGWVFFRSDTLNQALLYIGTLFTGGTGPLIDATAWLILHDNSILFILAGFGCTPIVKKLSSKLFHKNEQNEFMLLPSIFQSILVCATLLLCTVFLVNSMYNPFIYFRF